MIWRVPCKIYSDFFQGAYLIFFLFISMTPNFSTCHPKKNLKWNPIFWSKGKWFPACRDFKIKFHFNQLSDCWITDLSCIIKWQNWNHWTRSCENALLWISDQPAYYDGGGEFGPPVINSDSRHGRQLLKKLSNAYNFSARWEIFAYFCSFWKNVSVLK